MPEPLSKGEQIFRGIPVSTGVCEGKILLIDRARPTVHKRVLADS